MGKSVFKAAMRAGSVAASIKPSKADKPSSGGKNRTEKPRTPKLPARKKK